MPYPPVTQAGREAANASAFRPAAPPNAPWLAELITTALLDALCLRQGRAAPVGPGSDDNLLDCLAAMPETLAHLFGGAGEPAAPGLNSIPHCQP